MLGVISQFNAEPNVSIEYYVYVNPTNSRAVIHVGDCSHCNFGNGKRGGSINSIYGQWHGPFSKAKAEKVARESGQRKVKPCGHCASDLD